MATDWAAIADRARDRRRKRRALEPAYRDREAQDAKRYREAHGQTGLIEALWCPLCEAYWVRINHVGAKPKSCPTHRLEAQRMMEAADSRKRRDESRSPIQRLTCKACGRAWKRRRPVKACGAPQRCPACR